jgi:hypothetical protein
VGKYFPECIQKYFGIANIIQFLRNPVFPDSPIVITVLVVVGFTLKIIITMLAEYLIRHVIIILLVL